MENPASHGISEMIQVSTDGKICYIDEDSVSKGKEFIGFYICESLGFRPIKLISLLGDQVLFEYQTGDDHK